jgi:hypothetical protein
MTASNYAATNLTPRTNVERVKDKVDSRTYDLIVRSRSAHFNALEGFPLFAAAMVRPYPSLPNSLARPSIRLPSAQRDVTIENVVCRECPADDVVDRRKLRKTRH